MIYNHKYNLLKAQDNLGYKHQQMCRQSEIKPGQGVFFYHVSDSAVKKFRQISQFVELNIK